MWDLFINICSIFFLLIILILYNKRLDYSEKTNRDYWSCNLYWLIDIHKRQGLILVSEWNCRIPRYNIFFFID
jgi:hypothetical protein